MQVFQASLVTPPATLAVSVLELKNFLKIDNDADDLLLATLSTAATMRLEEFLGLKFITQKWKLSTDSFPLACTTDKWWDGTRDGAMSSLFGQASEMVLPFGKLQSADFSINTYADDNVANLFSSDAYNLDTEGPRGRVALKLGGIWPSTVLRSMNGIEITANFGFGLTAADIPTPITMAIKLLAAKMFENRGDDTGGEFFGTSGFTIPNTALMLIEPFRIFKVG